MAGIKDYSTTASSNTALFPEGMNPANVNNNMRQVQADIRTWYETPQWRDLGHTVSYASATTFTITGDVTASYIANQRIRCTDSSTLYGTIVSSSYSAPNTTVTVTLDSGSLSASLTAVAVGLDPTNKAIPATSISGTFTAGSIGLAALDPDFLDDATEVVITASDNILLGDVSDLGNTKRDTVQGILDLVPLATGTLIDIQFFVNGGGTTWTKPSGISYALVFLWGASGGGASLTNNGGAGGTTSFGSHLSVTGGAAGTLKTNVDFNEPAAGVATGSPDISSAIIPGGSGGFNANGGSTWDISQMGGRGLFCVKKISAGSLGATETVAIGAAGTAGAAGTIAGSPGAVGMMMVLSFN